MTKTISLLKDTKSFFRAFYDHCPMGLNLSRMDGRWVESNEAFLNIIGYTAEEANDDHLTYWQLTPGVYEPQEKLQLEKLKENGFFGPYEKEFIRKDGSLVPVRINGFIIKREGEDFIWSMIEDLTIEKKLKERLSSSADFNQAVFDNLPVSLFIKDVFDDWKYIGLNKKFEKLLQLNRENLIGKTDYDLFPKENADFYRAKDIEAMNSPKPIHISDEPINVPGKPTQWMHTSKVALNDEHGKPRYLLGITRDITAERKASLELLKINKDLRAASEEARKAAMSKSMFLSNMSHEIRTPLNSLLGIADLLQETELSFTQQEYLQLFNKAGKRLLEIVDDVLDYHRVESGQMNPSLKQENLMSVVESITELLKFSAEKAKLKYISILNIPEHLTVKTDGKYIHQILTNLISNSIKFTAAGGKVTIEAHFSEIKNTNKGELTLVVSDTGEGIPEEAQKIIFEPFVQVDSTVRKKYGGAGLGLAIVHHLVKSLSGDISLTSQLGVGTSFEIRLPILIVNTKYNSSSDNIIDVDSSRAKSLILNKEKLVILLADDSLENCWLVEKYLKNENLELVTAHNGKEAISMFMQHRPDLILMDIGMPIMDGYECTRKIRKIELDNNFNRVPIIAITGYVIMEEVKQCLDAGCDTHLSKPFFRQQLIDNIQKNLSKYQQAQPFRMNQNEKV
ncbi:MAG: PAS domain S-box protein [Bdellovibrionaceae bacterium]|nr:PAS domain S-box protein [Pseudobdellovibrionaceae bacterium]